MGNYLPTLTIVLAEINVLLLIVVGFLYFRTRRLRRLHQAEIDTLMAIAAHARLHYVQPGAETRAIRPQSPPTGPERHPTPRGGPPISAIAPAGDPARPSPLSGSGSTPTALTALLDPDSMSHLFALRTDGIDVEEINLNDLDAMIPQGFRDGLGAPSCFDEKKIFFHASLEDGMDQGWYFNGFGDYPHGPFADKDVAARVMKEMHEQITTFIEPQSGWTVSRKSNAGL